MVHSISLLFSILTLKSLVSTLSNIRKTKNKGAIVFHKELFAATQEEW